MSQCFPPYRSFKERVKVELDLSSYVDVSSFALKSDLASLKTEVDKIDVDKLKIVPVDVSKLSNVVNNNIVKKKMQDELVTKVNNIDTAGFVLKT